MQFSWPSANIVLSPPPYSCNATLRISLLLDDDDDDDDDDDQNDDDEDDDLIIFVESVPGDNKSPADYLWQQHKIVRKFLDMIREIDEQPDVSPSMVQR